jgi:hypothetical protein
MNRNLVTFFLLLNFDRIPAIENFQKELDFEHF